MVLARREQDSSSPSRRPGPLFICGVTACVAGMSLPGGDEGCGVSDDLETVCPSGRVMARRRSLTDQARREEIREEEEEEEGRGSLAALCLRLSRRGRWQQLEKRSSLAAVVQALLMETRKSSKSEAPARWDASHRPAVLIRF